MCGIVGFVGKNQATPILLKGLLRLEYRGYDSAGIAVRSGENDIRIIKTQGRIEALIKKTHKETALGNCGIGHTRWATHGAPSERNAHPQTSDDGEVALVHNGIIENHEELRQQLIKHGYAFHSETDTESAANLLSYYLKLHKFCPIASILAFMQRARGAYALAILFKRCPGEIYVLRKESPLIVGLGQEGGYLASDVSAILPYTQNAYYLGEREFARLTENEISFYNAKGERIEKQAELLSFDEDIGEKGEYRDYMRKEIHEQPQAVENTLNWLIKEGKSHLPPVESLQKIDQIRIVACGSAYHAGLVMQRVLEGLAGIPTRVDVASEFRYQRPLLTQNTLVLAVSQSGETADTLAGLKESKRQGVKTLSIVNVKGSTIARESDYTLFTQAGAEIAVATTKAYSAQLIVGYWLAIELGKLRGAIDEKRQESLFSALSELPKKIEETLKNEGRIAELAGLFDGAKNMFFIGRGVDYAVALEGSLKMKEISYVHSEAYPAGELKHGTLSLVEEGIWTVSVVTQSALVEKIRSNAQEIKSRGGKIFVVATEGIVCGGEAHIYLPPIEECFSASLSVLPLQMLSYYVSVRRGLDVDKPRNLAKSVTVE